MKRRKLTEIYGLGEDSSLDAINKSLSGAKSVARDPRAAQSPARVGAGGATQKAQGDLDQSKSIFDEAAGNQWVLVIRTDGVCYGPFGSKQDAEQGAAKHYPDPADLQHADENADFFVCELLSP